MLWHSGLGHISIERIKRLVNEGVLSTLDFANFKTCVNCIKGKQTNKSKKGAKRSYRYDSYIMFLVMVDVELNGPSERMMKFSDGSTFSLDCFFLLQFF